jgi:hypothetical protein
MVMDCNPPCVAVCLFGVQPDHRLDELMGSYMQGLQGDSDDSEEGESGESMPRTLCG